MDTQSVAKKGNCLSKYVKKYCCCVRIPKCLLFPCCKRRAELLLATEENTPVFTLKGLCFKGKVLKHKSNLRFSLALMFPDSIYKLKCELYGFEKIRDKISTEQLVNLMPSNMDVYVVCHDFNENGTLQVTLYENKNKYEYHDISLNEVLLIQTQVGSSEEDLEKLCEIELND